MTHWRRSASTAVFALTAWTHTAAAGELSFNQDIRPILADKCFACHGIDAKKRKADLRLDIPEGAFREKDGVRPIVPGKPDKSGVWIRIQSKDSEEVMPPPESHKTLSNAEKATLKAWIEKGAPYQKHWAFEAPAKITPPPLKHPARNALDSFILQRLQDQKLSLSPEADKPTLLRRLAFALTGLPPTPRELDEFLADSDPNAYEKAADRYLASNHFGQEMARHWLDIARYADTHGLHLDNERQMWAYRDWVVEAFNRNMPFDQFTIEQLAGDLLPNPSNDALVATGFNRCNVTTGEGGTINEEMIYRYAVERTSTTMQTWMGLTGGCAACHDHKFDPISQREFYSLYAFFNSAADPATDGNGLLTAPTVKVMATGQMAKITELDAKIAQKNKELAEIIAAMRYTEPVSSQPAPAATPIESIWLDDDFPAGAKVKYDGKWVATTEGSPVFSGMRALKRSGQGLKQDYYDSGPELGIPQDGIFFVHLWIDPKDKPAAVMVQFNTASTAWEQRAVWGDENAIANGTPNTRSRLRIGDLPEAGKWVRLEVPLAKFGLGAADKLKGFALTQFNGTTHWDKAGVTGLIDNDPAKDPRRSFTAWRKQYAAKDAPSIPPAIAKLLKLGPDKATNPDQVRELLHYYLQFVCVDTKGQFSAAAGEIESLKKTRDGLDKSTISSFIFRDLPNPRESFVMIRGAYDKPGDRVEPEVPAIFPPVKRTDPKTRFNRLDLARWLVAPEHPLTARVTVNRFWQQFMGNGIVKTSGDFGSQGEPPSHPELLDWLAVSFRDGGWDIKHLVRLMVTSATFRQSSRIMPEMLTRDPENRLYARGPRFRLDAEQLRDNALYVSGLINLQMGGAGVKTYQPPNIWEPVGFGGSNTRIYKQDSGTALYRRSLYVFLKRTAPAPFMANFDAPNRETACTRRERSNTPMQALQLMNDVQHFEAARMLAQRIIREADPDPDARIAYAYKVVVCRNPDPQETALVRSELQTHQARYKQDPAAARQVIAHGESKPDKSLDPAELAAYTLVMNMILNLNETVTRN